MKEKNISLIVAVILLAIWIANFGVVETNTLNSIVFFLFPIINCAMSVIFRKQNKYLKIILALSIIQLLVVIFMWYVGSQIG